MSQPAQEMNHGGRFHIDDRGTRYCAIFPEIEKGDINVTVVEPGAGALWHRHMFQDDYQFVIKGSLKVGMCNAPYMGGDDLENFGMSEEDSSSVYEQREELLTNWKELQGANLSDSVHLKQWPTDEGKVEWHYLSERNAKDGPLFIPRFLWHGCYNYTNEPAILIYHVTNKYDGEDEDRLDPFVAGWNYERVVK